MKNYWLANREQKNVSTKDRLCSVNERFLNEAHQIEAKWFKSSNRKSLLDQITNQYERATCAALLEGQRLMNEAPIDTIDIASLKRFSIPLIRKTCLQLQEDK